MLHDRKFELKYGLILCFAVSSNQKCSFSLGTKNFYFARNDYWTIPWFWNYIFVKLYQKIESK